MSRLVINNILASALAGFLLTSGLAGCSAPSDQPENLSDSLLAVVLADLHVLEAAKQSSTATDTLMFEDEVLDGNWSGTRDSVLAVHGFTEESFMKAMEPFVEDPDRYVGLYNHVLDHLIQRGPTAFSRDE